MNSTMAKMLSAHSSISAAKSPVRDAAAAARSQKCRGSATAATLPARGRLGRSNEVRHRGSRQSPSAGVGSRSESCSEESRSLS